MLNVICTAIIVIAGISAKTTCSDGLWGEIEMPEVLKKLNKTK